MKTDIRYKRNTISNKETTINRETIIYNRIFRHKKESCTTETWQSYWFEGKK